MRHREGRRDSKADRFGRPPADRRNAHDGPNQLRRRKVSATENKQVVRKFMDAMSKRDIQALADLTSDDLTYSIMGTATISGERDKDGFVEVATGLAGLLDGDIAFDDVVFTAEDDRVAA